MKLRWKLFSMIAMLLIVFGINAQAIIGATASEDYVIKVGDQFYSYNAEQLNESFLNFTYESGDDTLYRDFLTKISDGNFHAIMNEKGKYISYQAIEEAFLEDQSTFSISEYLQSSDAKKATMPSELTVVTTGPDGEIKTTTIELDNGIVPEVINIY